MVEDNFTTIRISRETLARVNWWTSEKGSWDEKINMLVDVMHETLTNTLQELPKETKYKRIHQ